MLHKMAEKEGGGGVRGSLADSGHDRSAKAAAKNKQPSKVNMAFDKI